MFSVCQELSSAGRLRGRRTDAGGDRDPEQQVSGCQAGSMDSGLHTMSDVTFLRVSAMQGTGETIVPHSVGYCEGKIASDTDGKPCSLSRVTVIL